MLKSQYKWILIAAAGAVLLAACTVSREVRDPNKVLVEEDNPIFDQRFSKISRKDIDLKNFWMEDRSSAPKPDVPLTNQTYARIVDTIKNGIVNIYTLRVEEREAKVGIAPTDILPMRIPLVTSILDVIPFKVPVPFRSNGISLGSGFVINDQGYILSNAHVILNATDIRVVLSGPRREYHASIIGLDQVTDTALIKIEPDQPLTSLPFGDSDELRVGEMVIAAGNPLGLNHTVTSGMVSAKERIVPNQMMDFLQTDSAINPGSSGGPLLNMYGEVVGINTAIVSSAQLIGFAIPINTVKEVMPLLVLDEKQRGWLGASARPLMMPDRAKLNMPGEEGILVTEVAKNSPAEKDGLQPNDVILAIDRDKVQGILRFRRKLLGLTPGQSIVLTVFRDGKTIDITSTLVKKPPSDNES